MRAETEYIVIGANHSSSCSASSSSGIVAYGAGRFIALWDTEDKHDRGVFATLGGHIGEVTKVKLLAEEDGRASFVSGDTTGEVRVWTQSDTYDFRLTLSFRAHLDNSISALGVLPSSGPLAGHILTGGADATIKLWNLKDGQAELAQTMDLKGKLPLDLETAYLPSSNGAVLAVGCTDKRVQLWVSQSGKFEFATLLEGHENWIRALSFTYTPSTSSTPERTSSSSSNSSAGGAEGSAQRRDLLLASGSQDNYIRLWRITSSLPPSENGGGLEALDEFERKLAEGGSTLSTKAHVLVAREEDQAQYYNVTLDALLMGHESGITDLSWRPLSSRTSSSSNPQLLSTSMDHSMVIWLRSPSGIWVPEHRFGTMGGGHSLGLYGAIWGKDGRSVCCSGWTGGWERWCAYSSASDGEVDGAEGRTGNDVWEVRPGITGHYAEVKSVSWDEKGDYLLSTSSDQTSRIHAPIPSSSSGGAGPSTWAEIARPQIHGYDMTSGAFITPLRFVSTADEKVARVFDAPGGFVESLGGLGIWKDVGDSASRPKGATVPPLGLSNRALGKDLCTEAASMDHPTPKINYESRDAVSQTLRSKPTEEVLSLSTLWPEVEKVYGHGYELVTVATSHSGDLIATACKASNAEHAVVRLNSTSTWDEVGDPLAGHTLTVTRIRFSADDSMILTCSRDRSWRLYRRKSDGSGYEPLAQEEKAHSRMILDTCWIGQTSFATASRDKTVKIWDLSESAVAVRSTVKLTQAATAVDYAEGHLAVGMENGVIEIYAVLPTVATAQDAPGHIGDPVLRLDSRLSHIAVVNRLTWCAQSPGEGKVLASCSDDKSLRVFRILEA